MKTLSALPDGEEVKALTYLISFVAAVAAKIVGDYISKWLGNRKPDK